MKEKYCFTLKSNCTSFVPSSCIDWVGNELKSIDISNCELSLTEIIEQLDSKIDFLLKITDVSNLEQCKNNDYQLNHILEIFLNSILDLKKQVALLSKKQTQILITDITFNIDTSCLKNEDSSYLSSKTIENLFKILYTEVCYLKTRMENV